MSAAIHMKRRQERQDVSAFASLIATPGTGAFTLPASARLYFLSVSGCAAGTTAATVGGRTIETPLLEAGAHGNVIYAERGVEVTPQADFEVHLDTGLGVLQKIGEGA
jgi:hypothetical protein